MTKNEIIELLTPRCNGYDLPLSLDVNLIADILINKSKCEHPSRSELQFNELYKLLNDKRMKQHIDITSSYWHLYRKQTAEYLLDKFDLVPKQ